MGYILANDLHVHKQILGQRMGDATANNIEMVLWVGHQIAGIVKGNRVDLAKSKANVVDDGVGEPIQKVF